MMSIQQETQLVEKPTREQVEKQLNRTLDSGALQKRGAALLKFVVEETLAGRSDSLKALTLATAVFGRDASFDPQNDPLIRFEAGVLRRTLEAVLSAVRGRRHGRDHPSQGGISPSV